MTKGSMQKGLWGLAFKGSRRVLSRDFSCYRFNQGSVRVFLQRLCKGFSVEGSKRMMGDDSLETFVVPPNSWTVNPWIPTH